MASYSFASKKKDDDCLNTGLENLRCGFQCVTCEPLTFSISGRSLNIFNFKFILLCLLEIVTQRSNVIFPIVTCLFIPFISKSPTPPVTIACVAYTLTVEEESHHVFSVGNR